MMRRLVTGGAGLFAAFMLVACADPAPTPTGPTDDEKVAAANALDDQFVVAFNSGDAVALTALYTPDAVSFPPDTMMARGQMSIQSGSGAAMSAMPGARLELIDQRNVVVGDAIVGYGLWRMTMPAADGTTTQMEGRFTDVKVMRDGKWLYMIDHASVPMPPPPAK